MSGRMSAGVIVAIVCCVAAPASTLTVERWALPGISSSTWESHPALDPRTGDLWFVRSDTSFAGWRILTARCRGGVWSDPAPTPIAGPGLEADPWFTADGESVWFISSRATGSTTSDALDIWRADREPDGTWRAPTRLPEPVNSAATEWFPRPASDGWLYFGSRRSGGFGRDDIWRARTQADGRWMVENAGSGLNTAGAEYEFQPAPDGTWGVLATDAGLVRVVDTGAGWRRAEKFGAEVNANGTEIGPLIAADGRSFAFSRDAGPGKSGELFVASSGQSDQWKAPCHAAMP